MGHAHAHRNVSLTESGQTFKNRAVLENFFTLEKKNGLHLQKWVTLENTSQFQKWATPAKIGHTEKNGSH